MAEQWDQFSRAVMAPNCSAIQRTEMRRAFYAGGQAIMFKVMSAISPESEPTPHDLQILSDLFRELSEFADLVKSGRA
jgi:hypothetical protein